MNISKILANASWGLFGVLLSSCSIPNSEKDDTFVPMAGLGARLSVQPLAAIRPFHSEGAVHLHYELAITNYDPRALSLVDLAIVDESGLAIASFGAGELCAMLSMPFVEEPCRLDSGTQRVLFLTLDLEDAPESLSHQFSFADNNGDSLSLDAQAVPIGADAPIAIGPPVGDGTWFAHAGPGPYSHHRQTLAPKAGKLTQDQRFAIDWLRFDAEGPDWNATFGSDVLAVADASVIYVINDLPDADIGSHDRGGVAIDWDTLAGNKIVLDLGNGHFAIYEHLKSGSILVTEGDQVKRGQTIAAVGNSGNTTHPHLHFSIGDSAATGIADGRPYALDCYSLLGRIDPMPSWDAVAEQTPSSYGGDKFARTNKLASRNELPLGGSLVEFSDCDVSD